MDKNIHQYFRRACYWQVSFWKDLVPKPQEKHCLLWKNMGLLDDTTLLLSAPKSQVPKDQMPCGCLPWLKMGKAWSTCGTPRPWSAGIRSQFPEGPERWAEDDSSICLVMGPLLLPTAPPEVTSNLSEGRTSPSPSSPKALPLHLLSPQPLVKSFVLRGLDSTPVVPTVVATFPAGDFSALSPSFLSNKEGDSNTYGLGLIGALRCWCV